MKKNFIYLCLALLLIGCKSSPKNELTTDNTVQEYNEFRFKVLGLQDSVIADSIWKMIFAIEGIEQMLLDKDDSIVVFKTNSEELKMETLKEELTVRGAIIIN